MVILKGAERERESSKSSVPRLISDSRDANFSGIFLLPQAVAMRIILPCLHWIYDPWIYADSRINQVIDARNFRVYIMRC